MDLSEFLYPGSRVAIVGSRDFPEPSLVESFVADLPECVVVTGSDLEGYLRGRSQNSCGGIVDLTAAKSAREFGLDLDEFPPDWGRYGRGAGMVRNREIVNSGLSVVVVFLKDPSRPSPGSASTMKIAKSAGVPVFVFGPDGSGRVKKDKAVQICIF